MLILKSTKIKLLSSRKINIRILFFMHRKIRNGFYLSANFPADYTYAVLIYCSFLCLETNKVTKQTN